MTLLCFWMIESIKDEFEKFKEESGASRVILVSRTGMFIEGDSLDNQDTFAAMSAIVLGASETATSVLGSVKRITVELDGGHKLHITSVGKRGVLAVISKDYVWDHIDNLRERIKDLV